MPGTWKYCICGGTGALVTEPLPLLRAQNAQKDDFQTKPNVLLSKGAQPFKYYGGTTQVENYFLPKGKINNPLSGKHCSLSDTPSNSLVSVSDP